MNKIIFYLFLFTALILLTIYLKNKAKKLRLIENIQIYLRQKKLLQNELKVRKSKEIFCISCEKKYIYVSTVKKINCGKKKLGQSMKVLRMGIFSKINSTGKYKKIKGNYYPK